jgi:hypothetical protein
MLKTSVRFSAALGLFLAAPQALFSQEQLGMRLERYAGIYGASINPANTAFNPNNWEISLFSADIFLENNYAYLQNTSSQNALRNSDKIVSVADTSAENPLSRDAILLDFFDAKRRMRAVAQARVAGPSFSFRFGEDNVIGLVTAFRSHASAYKIPKVLAYRTISDVPPGQAVDIAPTGFQAMSWAEIGLHYSRRGTAGDLHTAFGVTPRLLLGFESMYARSRSDMQYTDLPGDSVSFGNARWDYALTTGNFTDNSDSVKARVQGGGFGLDLGYVWTMPGDDESDYAWRFGVSLIDAGFVRFGKSAERHRIEFDTVIAVSNADFPPADDPHDLIEDASEAFLGNTAASLQSRAFTMGLPTALSVQLDYKAAPNLYVSGLIVQRIRLFHNSLQRPSTLALVPRFEHRWLSVSLPLVLDDWRSPRMGLAARLGFLYLGTDNLGSFFTKNKLTGADFYVGLKINAFSFGSREGSGLRDSGGGHGRQKRNKIKCYNF